MIRRIRIDGYKSFRNFEVELAPLSVILGPNASGKSNLLDAIYLLSQLVSRRNLKEAFEGHRGLPLESFFYGDVGYEGLLEKPTLQLRLEVDVGLSDRVRQRVGDIVRKKREKEPRGGDRAREVISEKLLRYRVVLEASPKTGYVKIVDERLAALRQRGEGEKGSRNPFIERVEKDGVERIHLRMERQAHPTYHDVGLEHTIVSTAPYEPYYPHVAALRMELENWRVYYLEPRELMREDVPIADVRSIGPKGENLAAFLNLLEKSDPSSFRVFNLKLSQVMPTRARLEVCPLREGRVGLRLFENGIHYSARLMSEGTLRLVGLLASLHPANDATLVAFEEPENGVHPVRLKIIGDILNGAAETGKQVIVTTHSSVLPTYFREKNLFVCRKEGDRTTVKPFRSLGPLFKGKEIESALEDRILRGELGG
jgi:predicted ATPase